MSEIICEGAKQTKDVVAMQLELLRDDFRRLPEEKLFRMYLHYMVEWCPDRFKQIIEAGLKTLEYPRK